MKMEVIPKRELLTLAETALVVRKSYSWMSRNWRRLGLTPVMMGRSILFELSGVEAAIARQSLIEHVSRPKN